MGNDGFSAATVPPNGLTPACGTGGENAEPPSPADGIAPGDGGPARYGAPAGGTATGEGPRTGPAMGATPTIVPFNLLGIPKGGAPGGPDPPRCVGPPAGGTLELIRGPGAGGGGVLTD